ncbi:hypothetical protein BU15DRAFT_75208 [Melanogaster broomeanus]|nr:hypothetical protein BU15DRAFT_75208 [Melanogaster broomeanus]
MTNNAGLYAFVPTNARLLANGMVYHSPNQSLGTRELPQLGLKGLRAPMFWKLVAKCIRHQPTTAQVLQDLSSSTGVKMVSVGTVTLGSAHNTHLPSPDSNDAVDFPRHTLVPLTDDEALERADLHGCIRLPRNGDDDGDHTLRIAMAIALPPASLLETVLLNLKEGEILSESTARRLRRKDAEARVAATEGRAPFSEGRRRKQKKAAAAFQAKHERSSARSPSQQRNLHQREVATLTTSTDTTRCKITAKDVERLATSASGRRRADRPYRSPEGATPYFAQYHSYPLPSLELFAIFGSSSMSMPPFPILELIFA